MEQRQLYNYYAFISYSSADKDWAKWLQRRLESYRLPAAVRKESIDIPKRLTPIFRDETDLSTGVLESVLRKELEASKYLIVLCSPNSANSGWVNNEVREFMEMGRTEQIIPLVISGEPHAKDPAREAFPPALLEMDRELIGISVEKFGRKEAFLRVVAALLGIRYDVLAMRDKKRSRRNRMLAGAAALIAAVGIGCGVWYNTPHSKYYSAYVKENEIPRGIHELSEQDREGLCYSYKITTQRGKVISLQQVNALDVVTDFVVTFPTTESPEIHYSYDAEGRLLSVTDFDKTGTQISAETLTYNESQNRIAVDFRADSDSFDSFGMAADALYAGSMTGMEKSEITRQVNTYDDHGRLIRSEFMRDNLGTRACDVNGVYGKAYAYDDRGQVIRISNLDVDGNVYDCKYGWATIELEYNEQGRIVAGRTYNAAGELVRNQTAYVETRYTYDEIGNLTDQCHYDAEGRMCNNSQGIAQVALSYDANGLCELLAFGNADDLMALNEEGAYALYLLYDELGRMIGTVRTDDHLNPIITEEAGFSIDYYNLDENGRVVTGMFFDGNYEPMIPEKKGYFAYDYVYNASGDVVEVLYYDADWQLCNHMDGYARWKGETDDNGNLTRIEFLDPEGRLSRCISLDAAVVEMDYDAFGNAVEKRYYDTAETLTAVEENEYADGNVIAVRFYDGQRRPKLGELGCFEGRYEYDTMGNVTKLSLFDTDGGLLKREDKVSVIVYEHDAYGNNTMMTAYDENMEFVSRLDYVYDERSNLIRGELTKGGEALSTIIVYKYSDNDTLVGLARYTSDGTLLDYDGEFVELF